MDLFSQKTNVNFVEVIDRTHIKIDTWERGAGHTLACGTGSLAAVFSLNRLGRIDRQVTVDTLGGRLMVLIEPNGTVHLEGPAVVVYEGVYKEDYND
jgi:diaminopimelate epimerase